MFLSTTSQGKFLRCVGWIRHRRSSSSLAAGACPDGSCDIAVTETFCQRRIFCSSEASGFCSKTGCNNWKKEAVSETIKKPAEKHPSREKKKIAFMSLSETITKYP